MSAELNTYESLLCVLLIDLPYFRSLYRGFFAVIIGSETVLNLKLVTFLYS